LYNVVAFLYVTRSAGPSDRFVPAARRRRAAPRRAAPRLPSSSLRACGPARGGMVRGGAGSDIAAPMPASPRRCRAMLTQR